MSELLSLQDKIDLVIPRGSNDLVRTIQQETAGRVPVLGHAEGICNVYVDRYAEPNMTINIGTLSTYLIFSYFVTSCG